MATYLEITRRQLADRTAILVPSTLMAGMSKQERARFNSQNHNEMSDVTPALNELGAAGWELVSVIEAESCGGEILYTFMKP